MAFSHLNAEQYAWSRVRVNVPIFTYVSGLQLLLLIDPHVSLTIRHILKIYKSNCGTWADDPSSQHRKPRVWRSMCGCKGESLRWVEI